MDYRALGNSGLRVSAISFGASSLGGVFRSVDETEAIEAVHVRCSPFLVQVKG